MVVCAFTLIDERSLVEGARMLGFIFFVRTPEYVTVSTVNTLLCDEILHCISKCYCCSVVVVLLYCDLFEKVTGDK